MSKYLNRYKVTWSQIILLGVLLLALLDGILTIKGLELNIYQAENNQLINYMIKNFGLNIAFMLRAFYLGTLIIFLAELIKNNEKNFIVKFALAILISAYISINIYHILLFNV